LRIDFSLYRSQGRERGDKWRREVQRDGLAQVVEGVLFCLALTRDVDLQTLRDKPVALAHDAGGERALHRPASLGCFLLNCQSMADTNS
jgi:hypothetical protein